MRRTSTAEQQRLVAHRERKADWKKWGPYLSERAWGTVREDYSDHGTAWDYFPHDHARSRTYRWNEDGLAGISDRKQHLCFCLALWNGRDPILKERLFGLSGGEGNHGEDVKEHYFYLDNTPTHSYMKMLYKYPQRAFPYTELVARNRERSRAEPEYELLDTGIFSDRRYFDILVEYAKSDVDDILIRITATNRGPEEAVCHLLPTLWFRNTWSWGYPAGPMGDAPGKPLLRLQNGAPDVAVVRAKHATAGVYHLYAEGQPQLLFTENESNMERLFDIGNSSPYVKDAFHRFVIGGERAAVHPGQQGTKTATWYRHNIPAGESVTLRLRLSGTGHEEPFGAFETIFDRRQDEANEFYAAIQPRELDDESRSIQRQALAGLLWTKQLYYIDIRQWLHGDPHRPESRLRHRGRNADWEHLNNFDVISMPDKWEYPWYAAWDLAFHMLPLALVDIDYAKQQLLLITRVWYMHPNGQLPAYEWAFDDVNPPVHAWAALRVYQWEKQHMERGDRPFLEAIFHKLLLNFTWWINRKDADGNNIFQGGFLGLDNIGVFDRSGELPVEGHIDQADGTAWMAFYCLNMLEIALELAKENAVYQDMATKFFEHFLRVAYAMTESGGHGYSLWDERDGFFYDALHTDDGHTIPLRVRSLVGLLPLFATAVLEPEQLHEMDTFLRRLRWFVDHRAELSGNMASVDLPGMGERRLLALLTRERLIRLLQPLLDEREFLSPYGIRSVSRYHEDHPYTFHIHGHDYTVMYEPAESQTRLFGGNSNWRGPIWFPINYLIIESLRTYHRYYGERLTVECPTGSGQAMTLAEVADDLSRRLQRLFLPDQQGGRPVYGPAAGRTQRQFQHDPDWQSYVLFYEYFHGDHGAGLGASHQTGWTALIANLIQQAMEKQDA